MQLNTTLRQLGEVNTGHVLRGLLATARETPSDLSRYVRQSADLRIAQQVQRPNLTLLKVLRRVQPTLTLGGKVNVVTRAHDVCAVLADDDRYRVTPYARTMTDLLGPFALGQDGAAHAASRAVLAEALSAIDLPRVAEQARAVSTRLVRAGRPDGYLELVCDLAHPVLTEVITAWFGMPDHTPPPARSADARPDQVTTWATSAFEAVFLNSAGDRTITADGRAAMTQLSALAQLGVASPAPGSVFERLVEAHDEKTTAVVDLVGLVVASVATVTEALLQVVNELLDRPAVLAQVVSAADRCDLPALWAHALECLRFSPQGPALLRTPTASGLPVMVSTFSAMHDPTRVSCPHAYRVDRPSESYLHFGHGSHACLGEPLAAVLIPAMLAALFTEAEIIRQPGDAGRLDPAQAIPHQLQVRLESRPAPPPSAQLAH